MFVEFNCKGCGKRYRVDESLAGRMAECTSCGQKMVVPYKSPLVKLREENLADESPAKPPPLSRPIKIDAVESSRPMEFAPREDNPSEFSDDKSPPDIDELDVKDDAPEPAQTVRVRLASLLPPVLSDLLLPMLLMLGGLGGATSVVVMRILGSSNLAVGFILLALMLSLLFIVIVPLTMRGLDGAANSLGYKLANSIWLQTVGLISMPSSAMTIGYFTGGMSGLITWGIIGSLAMAGLLVLIFPTDTAKALVSWMLAELCYVAGSALSVGIVALLALVLTRAGMLMPWQPKPEPVVARAEPAPPPAAAPKSEPAKMALAPEKRVVIQPPPVIKPIEPPKPTIVWAPAVDAQSSPIAWPTDAHYIIDVKPPIVMAQAASSSPFVAFTDQVAFQVYDLRTGHRCGFIKEKIPAAASLLSPDASLLVVNRLAGNAYARSAADGFEIWSIHDARLARRITFDLGKPVPQILGFDRDNNLITATNLGMKSRVQLWNTESASVVREFDAAPQIAAQIAAPVGTGQSVALSAGGRFIASVVARHLLVYDTTTGKQIGDRELPPNHTGMIQAVSFSLDGSQLASTVRDASTANLLIWDTRTGEIEVDKPTAGGAHPNVAADQLNWIPNGGAMLVGSDWIDSTSAGVVAVVPPQLAGQATGRPRLMMNDFNVLVEFLPTGNAQKLIYKTVSLPRKDIQTALAPRRAKAASDAGLPSTQPSEPDRQVASTSPSAPSALPATTASATTAPTDPKDLVRDAVAQLAGGHNREALTSAQAALSALPKSVKPACDESAVALHCVAVAEMRLGDFQKARDPIDKAAGYTKTCRSLQINRAKLDIIHQGFLIRAGKELDRLLMIAVDEDTLNLMGVAIDKAMKNSAMAGQAKTLALRYEEYNKKLEATRPGMRHWGSHWFSDAEYNNTVNPPALLDRKIKGESRLKFAQAEVDRSRQLFADAKNRAFFDQAKKNIDRDRSRGNQPMYLTRAENDFNNAVKESESAKIDLDTIEAQFPHATWVENLEPLVPELDLVPRSE